jgi:hypothetical protein
LFGINNNNTLISHIKGLLLLKILFLSLLYLITLVKIVTDNSFAAPLDCHMGEFLTPF